MSLFFSSGCCREEPEWFCLVPYTSTEERKRCSAIKQSRLLQGLVPFVLLFSSDDNRYMMILTTPNDLSVRHKLIDQRRTDKTGLSINESSKICSRFTSNGFQMTCGSDPSHLYSPGLTVSHPKANSPARASSSSSSSSSSPSLVGQLPPEHL